MTPITRNPNIRRGHPGRTVPVVRPHTTPGASAEKKTNGFQPFGADGLRFRDLIDIVNPLQHVPIISSLYRKLTGDNLDPASRVAGGTLFFGPLGTAMAAVNVAIKQVTGKDIGGHVIALFHHGERRGSDDSVLAASNSDLKNLTVNSDVRSSNEASTHDPVIEPVGSGFAGDAVWAENQPDLHVVQVPAGLSDSSNTTYALTHYKDLLIPKAVHNQPSITDEPKIFAALGGPIPARPIAGSERPLEDSTRYGKHGIDVYRRVAED